MQIGSLDTEQIVTSLMQIERRPLFDLQARQKDANVAVDAVGRVRTAMESFRLAATRLADVATFNRFKATVSQPDAVTATVSGASFTSSISFNVDQLARSHGLRSVTTVASEDVPVTNATVIAVASGTLGIGIDTVTAGAGLGEGSIQLDVIQATTAAASVGSSPVASSTVVDGTNNTLNVTVNGTAHSLTLASGTYSAEGLAAAVQTALDGAGVAATSTLDSTGALRLATAREGSTATLQVTGGSSLASLGLAVDTSARVGSDGIIDVGGTTTTVTQAEAGQAVAVDTGAGTLDIALSGGLRVGSTSVEVVSTGDRSLAAVAAAINGAGNGVGAAAVRVGTDQWRLQLSATTTGLDGHIAVDGAVLTGGMVQSSAAQNAQITIGDGAGAYTVEASGNTFTDVISGVTLTAKTVTTSAVTIDVERNDDAIADDVAKLVSNATSLLAEIKVQTRYDASTNTSGPLSGDSAIRRIADQVRQALTGQVAGVTGALPSTAGIQLTREGSVTFDKATFLAAVADDPELIGRLFGRGGTDTGDAVFANATAETISGSYDIDVTTAATRATSATLFDGGATADTRVGVRIGTVTATYDVTNGQSAAQIIDGLNAAIASAGLDVIAELDGTGLRLRADEWGASGDFELNDDVLGAGVWAAQTGTDVAGTIDGIAATGIGRRLSLNPLVDSPAAGLEVDITGGVSGALGAVDYQPGIAARIAELATASVDEDTGMLTSVADAAERRVTELGDRITRLEDRLVVREANLWRQWSALQTLLGGLEAQSNWITGQLATLPTNSSS